MACRAVELYRKLKSILRYHVVAGNIMAETAVTLNSAKTLQGSSFGIMFDGKTLKVDDAAVIQADIKASNGVMIKSGIRNLPREGIFIP